MGINVMDPGTLERLEQEKRAAGAQNAPEKYS